MGAELDQQRLVLWAGSALPDAPGDIFPRGNFGEGVLVSYSNSSGAPHPQPEKQRLPQQPKFLALWLPAEEHDPETLVDAFLDHFTPVLGERSLVTHCIGPYEPTGGLTPPRRDAEFAGLMVGLTDCIEPNELSAFQSWYDDVHAAEALAPGIFETARRYRRTHTVRTFAAETPPHTLTAPEFLALYESRRPGAEAVAELMLPAHRPPSPLHPSCRVRAVWAFDRR
ncbi:MAG: hypothetical protein AB7K71_21470 [Polyangiaceae bacterium]